MHVSQVDRVSVRVVPGPRLVFECVLCTSELRWSDGWWICDCGIEMTVSEGRQVLEEARAMLDESVGYLGGTSYRERGFVGWLKRVLGLGKRRLRLP